MGPRFRSEAREDFPKEPTIAGLPQVFYGLARGGASWVLPVMKASRTLTTFAPGIISDELVNK